RAESPWARAPSGRRASWTERSLESIRGPIGWLRRSRSGKVRATLPSAVAGSGWQAMRTSLAAAVLAAVAALAAAGCGGKEPFRIGLLVDCGSIFGPDEEVT